jgi:hypothetical protein
MANITKRPPFTTKGSRDTNPRNTVRKEDLIPHTQNYKIGKKSPEEYDAMR